MLFLLFLDIDNLWIWTIFIQPEDIHWGCEVQTWLLLSPALLLTEDLWFLWDRQGAQTSQVQVYPGRWKLGDWTTDSWTSEATLVCGIIGANFLFKLSYSTWCYIGEVPLSLRGHHHSIFIRLNSRTVTVNVAVNYYILYTIKCVGLLV